MKNWDLDAHSKERRLEALLRHLPREKASPGFATRVLKDLGTESKATARNSWGWLPATAGLLLGLTAVLWWLQRSGASAVPRDDRARLTLENGGDGRRELLQQLRQELRAIEAALTDKGDEGRKRTRAVSLGKSQGYEILLDLDSLRQWADISGERVLAPTERYQIRPL